MPPFWEELTDRSTGRKYYVNHQTQETTWERPTIALNKSLSTESSNVISATISDIVLPPTGDTTRSEGSETDGNEVELASEVAEMNISDSGDTLQQCL